MKPTGAPVAMSELRSSDRGLMPPTTTNGLTWTPWSRPRSSSPRIYCPEHHWEAHFKAAQQLADADPAGGRKCSGRLPAQLS